MEADSSKTEGRDRMSDDTHNDEGHRGSARRSETWAKMRPREEHSLVSAPSVSEVYILLLHLSTETPFLRPPKTFSSHLEQSPVDHPAERVRDCSVWEGIGVYWTQGATKAYCEVVFTWPQSFLAVWWLVWIVMSSNIFAGVRHCLWGRQLLKRCSAIFLFFQKLT